MKYFIWCLPSEDNKYLPSWNYSNSSHWFGHHVDRKALLSDVAEDIKVPHFEALIQEFLQHHVEFQPAEWFDLNSNINIYTSAIAVFHAPSDICSVHGMAREQVHATPRWEKFQVPHYDTTFVVTNLDIPSMSRLDIARVKLFFSFKHRDRTYPCALIHWFSKIGEEPDVNTGMWWVEPNFDAKGKPLHAVILWFTQLTYLVSLMDHYLRFCSRFICYFLH